MIWELMDFITQVVGISVMPSDCMSLILILEGMLLRVMKSLLRTSAKAQSALRERGRVKLRKRELGTIGLFWAKLTWVMKIAKSWATEVRRILVLFSMAYAFVGSLKSRVIQLDIWVESMDMPLTVMEQLVRAGRRAVLPRVIVRTLRLLLGRQLTMGTVVELAEYFMLQRLVDTNIPKRLATMMEPTSMSWKVVNYRSQKVLVTPRELSLQLTVKAFITPVQNMFWFWFMNSLQPSRAPCESIRLTEWQGRSRLQGNFMLSNIMSKLLEYTPVVLKGMQVKKELEDIFMKRGVCSTLANWGSAEFRDVLCRAVVESKNCHDDITIRALLQPLPLKLPEGATVKLTLESQDPASPAILSCMAACLGLEQTRMLAGVRQVEAPEVGIRPELRQVIAPLLMSTIPTMISKRQGAFNGQRVGMMMLNLLEDQVPGRMMLILSQLRGYSVVRFCELEPWMYWYVAARLLAHSQLLQLLRVVKRFFQPWQANRDMILRSLTWTTLVHSAGVWLTSRMTLTKLDPLLYMLLLKQISKPGIWFLSWTTIGTAKYLATLAREARETVSWKQKWQMQEEWEEAQLNLSWSIWMVVVCDWGQRLKEELEAIRTMVFSELVVTVQGWAELLTRQELAPLKVASATICLLVYIQRKEPAQVVKRGVTEKEMLLVVVCIAVSLLVSPPDPVRAEMKFSGSPETVAEVVPQIMGAEAVMWAAVSILTQMLKMGLAPIQALKVTVSRLPEGMVPENPET